MDYQWDPEKADSNLRRHRIDFADAVGVFEDEWGLTLRDDESDGELRFLTLGADFLGRVLVVVYTYRGESIRIIPARRATSRERKTYEQKRARL
jgi:hypothetical protein